MDIDLLKSFIHLHIWVDDHNYDYICRHILMLKIAGRKRPAFVDPLHSAQETIPKLDHSKQSYVVSGMYFRTLRACSACEAIFNSSGIFFLPR